MQILMRSDLKKKGVKYSSDHLKRLENRGLFPKSFALGPGRRAYSEDEIDRWLEARAAARGE